MVISCKGNCYNDLFKKRISSLTVITSTLVPPPPPPLKVLPVLIFFLKTFFPLYRIEIH
jgi:hypothetical protein